MYIILEWTKQAFKSQYLNELLIKSRVQLKMISFIFKVVTKVLHLCMMLAAREARRAYRFAAILWAQSVKLKQSSGVEHFLRMHESLGIIPSITQSVSFYVCVCMCTCTCVYVCMPWYLWVLQVQHCDNCQWWICLMLFWLCVRVCICFDFLLYYELM